MAYQNENCAVNKFFRGESVDQSILVLFIQQKLTFELEEIDTVGRWVTEDMASCAFISDPSDPN